MFLVESRKELEELKSNKPDFNTTQYSDNQTTISSTIKASTKSLPIHHESPVKSKNSSPNIYLANKKAKQDPEPLLKSTPILGPRKSSVTHVTKLDNDKHTNVMIPRSLTPSAGTKKIPEISLNKSLVHESKLDSKLNDSNDSLNVKEDGASRGNPKYQSKKSIIPADKKMKSDALLMQFRKK